MLSLIVIVAAAAVVWRLGYWPFDRDYKFVPTYGNFSQPKTTPPPVVKTGP